MKNIYLFMAAIAFIASGYIVLNSCKPATAKVYFGDADAIGSEEDANARFTYDWMMLQDPATGQIPAHIREKELAFAAGLPKDGDVFGLNKATALTWQSRGPWNVGGRTRACAMDITNENVIVAGTCSGGMWRSSDQGQNWVTTTPSDQYQSVSCVAQDTRIGHRNVWYYGTGEAYGASASGSGAYYFGNGIFKSIDSGKTWTVLASTTSANLTTFDKWADVTWNIVTNPASDTQDVVYVAAYGGIYRSIDGGTNWSLVKGTSGAIGGDSYFTDIAISSTGIIYATISSDGSQKGIFRSTDGLTFTDITPSNFPAVYNRLKIGISPSNEEQVYFLGNTPNAGLPDTNYQGDIDWNSLWRYTYLSGDGSGAGGAWEDRSANMPHTGGQFDKFRSQGSYDLVVKVKPDDTNTVFIGGTNLYNSTSAFRDDTHTAFMGGYEQGTSLPLVHGYLNHHPDQHELIFFPSDPKKCISSNDGGIFKTNDNTASTVVWNSLNNGYLTTMFYTTAIDHAANNDIIIGGAQDNGSWFTNSSSLSVPWVTPRGGDGSYCAITDNGNPYYFSIQSGKIMKAKLNASGGVDSFARIDPIGLTNKDYLFINPFVLDPNNNNKMYLAGGKYLWRNNDLSGIPYAGNWDSISTNWIQFSDSVPTANAKITAIAVSKTPANRVYYGTSVQKIYRIDNANIGTPTPVDITATGLPAPFPGNGYVSCIAVDPNDADHVMVVFSNYGVYSLFYSSNGGTSWSKAGGNLELTSSGSGNGPSCRWARIIPVNGGTVYLVGTSVGLFATGLLNGTSTVWVQQGTGTIGNSVVTMIDHRATDGLVAVATHAHGIFSTHIIDISDVAVKEITSNAGRLNLNCYPNPFSDQTNIIFTLQNPCDVNLNVYDLSGKLVRVIADGNMDAGEKKFQLSAYGLSPGMYFCLLRAGLQTETKGIVLQ